jgi:hypothetical protein
LGSLFSATLAVGLPVPQAVIGLCCDHCESVRDCPAGQATFDFNFTIYYNGRAAGGLTLCLLCCSQLSMIGQQWLGQGIVWRQHCREKCWTCERPGRRRSAEAANGFRSPGSAVPADGPPAAARPRGLTLRLRRSGCRQLHMIGQQLLGHCLVWERPHCREQCGTGKRPGLRRSAAEEVANQALVSPRHPRHCKNIHW